MKPLASQVVLLGEQDTWGVLTSAGLFGQVLWHARRGPVSRMVRVWLSEGPALHWVIREMWLGESQWHLDLLEDRRDWLRERAAYWVRCWAVGGALGLAIVAIVGLVLAWMRRGR